VTVPDPAGRDVAATAGSASEAITRANVLSGSGWVLASSIVPQAFTFVTSVAIARTLGADGVGRVAFIAFVSGTLSTILLLGLPPALMRYVSETLGSGRPGLARALLRSILRVVILPASLCLVGLVAVGVFGGEPRWAWIFAGIACAGAVLHSVPASFLLGARRFRESYVIGITTGAVGSMAKVGALLAGAGVSELFAIDAAVVTVNVLGTTYLASRVAARFGPASESAGDLTRNVLRFAAIASLGLIINIVVYERSEVFFLERYSSDEQIALYAIPFSIVLVLMLLPAAIGTVVAPAVATLYGAGQSERIRSGFARALRVVLLFSFAATALSFALGPTAITLVYGSEFERAGPVLLVMLATLPFVPLMSLGQSLLLGIGKAWGPAAIGVLAAAVNVGLALILIPSYEAIGAAVANSTAQIVGSVPLVLYAAACLGGVPVSVAGVARGIAAACLAGAAAFATAAALPDAAGVPLGVLVFAAVGAPLAVTLRVLPADDVDWLKNMLAPSLARPFDVTARALARFPIAWSRSR
jgi:O-antigen/teichoic acid export membrane protein